MSWKDGVRQRMWRVMEAAAEVKVDVSWGKGPFHGCIPPFKTETFAINRLTSLEAFTKADVVKIEQGMRFTSLRRWVLEWGKHLAWTQSVDASSFYSVLTQKEIPFPYDITDAASIQATREGFGDPVLISRPALIDLVVVPSLVVDPDTGQRVGIGDGHMCISVDLEWAIMKQIGAVNNATRYATVVHEKQLCDLKRYEMEKYDVPVDFVLTPSKTYRTQSASRPDGLYWDLLKDLHFQHAPCLKDLRAGF